MDCPPNPVISSAATDVARHRLRDLLIGGLRRLCQENRRSHDLPRLTITALRDLLLDPCLLQGMQPIPRQTLDRGDVLRRDLRDGCGAGTHDRSINVDRTCATKTSAT